MKKSCTVTPLLRKTNELFNLKGMHFYRCHPLLKAVFRRCELYDILLGQHARATTAAITS
jgi:hypothetical protein